MFSRRDLPDDLASVRETHVPGALVLDCEADFETLPPAQAEELGLLVDSLDPVSYPEEWLPPDAPAQLRAYAGRDFTVGMPGDGGVTWTRQTAPPTVLVKARTEGSPGDFVDFLVGEALVEAGLGLPEHFLGFFEERYREFAAAVDPSGASAPADATASDASSGRTAGLSPADTYQLAVALYDAYLGLHTREAFRGWASDRPRLHAAWADAGQRLQPRLSGLSREVATDRTDFATAAELACAGLKHDLDLPTPFGALDTEAYREYGADYAVTWARKTFEKLRE
ncbi:DUF7089 family protein [Halomarina pelagica]|uniref:DUF7089 family protein n=1 Tax=Halomarina pelagica TaxID=2961599 RepID=UPI0020C24B97|nr:hypothetical protein [Halomarina sp. BND7]